MDDEELPPPFYNSIEAYREQKMADKRTYKDILASVETHFIYINTHLTNIDQHLEKINTVNVKQEVKIARNKDRIGLISKIGGGLLTILSGGSVALILKLLGVY